MISGRSTALVQPALWFCKFTPASRVARVMLLPLAAVLLPSSYFVFNRRQKLSAIILEDILGFACKFFCI